MKKIILSLTLLSAMTIANSDFATCATCHGVTGTVKALGISAQIAGKDASVIEGQINGYKAGTLNQYGQGTLMTAQVSNLSDAQIKALATYISAL